MNLVSPILNNFSTTISSLPISLNLDIFEANVINLTILIGGIIYLFSGALSESLSERQQKILGTISESEERLKQASERLIESETQLAQSQLVIDSITKDAERTATQVKNAVLSDGKKEIERLTYSVKAQVNTVEAKIRKQISEYVVTLALKRITLQLEGKLTQRLQQQIIDQNISKLDN